MKFLILVTLLLGCYLSPLALAAPDISIDSSAAPNLKSFLDNSASTIRRYWDDVANYLASPGFTPPRSIKLVAKRDLGAPASAGGNQINYDVAYAERNPRDMGMSVHEATHLIQAYRNCPGWITEGVADYIRYFRQTISGDENRKPRKPRNGAKGWERGYGDTAYFLDWTQKNKNRNLVPRLNRFCREGTFNDNRWRELTRQTVQQSWDEMQQKA